MDLSPIFNWPGITLCVSIISAAWYFVSKEVQTRKTARLEIAVSKIYAAIERFICTTAKVRANINMMPLDYLLKRKSAEMDEWITQPIFELENIAILTEMFFDKTDRGSFNELISAARDFKTELHKASTAFEDRDKLDIYDKARVSFNKRYNSAMANIVEMLNHRLLGEWKYDLTGWRLNIFQRRQAGRKRNQQ